MRRVDRHASPRNPALLWGFVLVQPLVQPSSTCFVGGGAASDPAGCFCREDLGCWRTANPEEWRTGWASKCIKGGGLSGGVDSTTTPCPVYAGRCLDETSDRGWCCCTEQHNATCIFDGWSEWSVCETAVQSRTRRLVRGSSATCAPQNNESRSCSLTICDGVNDGVSDTCTGRLVDMRGQPPPSLSDWRQPNHNRDGILYIVYAHRPQIAGAYVSLAKQSVVTVRASVPLNRTVHVTVITTAPWSESLSDSLLFDSVIIIDEHIVKKSKIAALLFTPYARTLFLDADVIMCESALPGLELLDWFDLAMVPESDQTIQASKVKRLPLDGEGLYNSGVLFYRRDAVVFDFLINWQRLYDDDTYCSSHTLYTVWDQCALWRAIRETNNLKVASLANTYNARENGVMVQGTVRVLHFRGATPSFCGAYNNPAIVGHARMLFRTHVQKERPPFPYRPCLRTVDPRNQRHVAEEAACRDDEIQEYVIT